MRVVSPGVGCVISGGRRLIEMQGAPLCVFEFLSCVRVGFGDDGALAVGDTLEVARCRSVGCSRSVFPCFWRPDYHLFFATWGFVAVWFGVVVPMVSRF